MTNATMTFKYGAVTATSKSPISDSISRVYSFNILPAGSQPTSSSFLQSYSMSIQVLNCYFHLNILFSCFRIVCSYSQKLLTTWTSWTIPLYKNLTICAPFESISIVATMIRFFGSIYCTNIPA